MAAANPTDLAERTALVTGGARRLGRAMVETLSAGGARVVVHYGSSGDEANQLVDTLRRQGGLAYALQADLADASRAESLLGEAADLAGRSIDVLINNASIFPADTLADVTPESLATNMQIHAMAPLSLTRAMAKGCKRGDVINMIDARVVDFDRQHASYHLSKRTLATLTKMLARELAPSVRVNGICPGLILPPPGQDERYLEDLAHTNPLNAHGRGDDITRAMLFLLESPFVTGQLLFIDGGRHLKGRMYE